MSTSTIVSSLVSIPLPPAAPQIRRPAKTKNAGVVSSPITRQMSRNLDVAVGAPAFQSVPDFLSAYDAKKKTIDDLTGKFALKAAEAKQMQDDILPHLAYMQSLLSKKGANHHLVIAARKQGKEIPWWTEYYESYKERLWESLRTMERRIAAYRNDPTAPTPKRNTDSVPHLNKAAQKVLIEGNHKAVEIVAALEAGRDANKEISEFKAVMNATRLDDIMQAHEQEPDYKGILSKVLQIVANMESKLPAEFVKTIGEVTKACKPKLAAAPVLTVKTNGTVSAKSPTSKRATSTVAKPAQLAPVPQKPPAQSPLKPGKRYTVRPHPQGGYGIFEPASPVCLQKHSTMDAAWAAIDAVKAVPPSAAQAGNPAIDPNAGDEFAGEGD